MKRSLLLLLFLCAAARPCLADVGVALGWPYAGVKYKFSRTALEALGAADESVSLFAGRFYWNFAKAGGLDLFTGVEGGRVHFDTVELNGGGYETAAFLGAEYYISKHISLSMDLAPTVIWLKSGRHETSGVEWVLNTALYIYITPPAKKRPTAIAPAPAGVPAADRPKLAVATFKAVDVAPERGGMVSNLLESELLKSGCCQMVKRTDMAFILAEHALPQADPSGDAAMAQLGKALGVDKLLAGSVARGENEEFILRAGLIDPATGAAVKTGTATAADIYTLMDAAKRLAAELLEN